VGRKVWTREVLASADVNELLMDQTVPRFPSASARAVDYPAPDPNALSMLDTALGRVDYWHPTGGPNGASGAWLPLNYGASRGKIWRTVGGGALTQAVEAVCTMQGSRVSGGFTFDGADSLVVPFDGRLDLDVLSYITNPGAGNVAVWVRRVRSGVANSIVGQHMIYKPYSTIDVQQSVGLPGVPLKTGDKLSLGFYAYTTNLAFYGAQELIGCSLTATYAGPLNGATPA
jgi:hypothetical protein